MLTDFQAKTLYDIDANIAFDIDAAVLAELEDNGLIENGALTDTGKEKLADYINWID